jgi:glycosyltransferase involved in cell wall biosynthesis
LNRKLRILLLAELCSPRLPSVPLEAYALARALSERDDIEITLVSQVRSREVLESDPIANKVDLHFIDTEFIGRPLWQLGQFLRGGSQLSWTTAVAVAWPAYMIFERMVYRRFRDKLRAHSFDLIHRISPISPTMGSPLAGMTEVPMLIGPLNGGLPWPAEYPNLRRKEREWLVPLRGLYRYLPYHRSTYRHIRGVIAGSWHTATEIPAWYRGRRYYVPENAVDPERIPLSKGWWPREAGSRFRFVTVGRLVPYKGFDLVLQALAQSEELRREAELFVIGDGPDRAKLQAQVSELGLGSIVTFTGRIEHAQVQDHLHHAQAFVFPSLREFGGAVVLEAMASGLPPIVVDYGGPGELVSDESGIRLPMAPRDELVGRVSSAMVTVVRDPQLCERMSDAGIDRVRRGFTWSRKAAQIVTIYRDLLGLPHADLTNTSIGPPPQGYWAPSESDEQILGSAPVSPQDGFYPSSNS